MLAPNLGVGGSGKFEIDEGIWISFFGLQSKSYNARRYCFEADSLFFIDI